MPNPRRHDKYVWLLTADPPICAGGRPTAVLNQCSRRRNGQECYCRFDAAEIGDDLGQLGATELARTLEECLDADEVAGFAEDVRRALEWARSTDDELVERLRVLGVRLGRLVEHEAGLTDRYSDDVDP